MNLELRPIGATPADTDLVQVAWGEPSDPNSDLNSSVDAWLSELGRVAPAAVDLVRLATAAFVADRLSPRQAGFSRSIHIHVQLCRVSAWRTLLPRVEALLTWLSGDEWRITASAETGPQSRPAKSEVNAYESVCLMSGGLDSFSGALLTTEPTLFLSHTDNPTVTGAQRKAWAWLQDGDRVQGERVQVSLSERAKKRENTTRTRAFLFYALAVGAADGCGATRVEVPENGFTSLNLALGNDRGGVLSTRSTHPWTMHLIRSLLADLGLQVDLVNPYVGMTKGELVALAATATDDFAKGVATTLSCAKLDGRTYKGGDPNLNCGLCVACLTRRASIDTSGIDDPTRYLLTTLKGKALASLKARRSSDVRAVIGGLASPPDEFTVLEYGPYPLDYDLGDAAALCQRGFAELARVADASI